MSSEWKEWKRIIENKIILDTACSIYLFYLQNGEQKQQFSAQQTAINRKLTGENILSCFQLYNRFLFIEKHKKWSCWTASRCWSTKLATHHQKQKITIKTNKKTTEQKHCRSCKYGLPNSPTVNHFHQCLFFLKNCH